MCSFVPRRSRAMGRENAPTMMQPSSDQANTKAHGCELPGDKTILPQLPLDEARSTHMAPTWFGCGGRTESQNVGDRERSSSRCFSPYLIRRRSRRDMRVSLTARADAAGGDVTQQAHIWCSCSCRRLGARTPAKAGHHPDRCTTAPIAAMIDMVVMIE